jgi:DNA-binding response OmpR family regulator
MKNDAKPLVLIVDDNPQNLQVLGSILSKNGYEPVVFLNGSDALAFLQQEPPSLVLLDVIMPEMDGYDVCRQIKSHPSTENIPVIFLTAKAQTQDLVQGFECGAVDYITKPFNSLELLSRVQTHVSLREMQKTLEDKNALLQKEISLRIEAE